MYNPESMSCDLYATQVHELKRTVKQFAIERENLLSDLETLRNQYSESLGI